MRMGLIMQRTNLCKLFVKAHLIQMVHLVINYQMLHRILNAGTKPPANKPQSHIARHVGYQFSHDIQNQLDGRITQLTRGIRQYRSLKTLQNKQSAMPRRLHHQHLITKLGYHPSVGAIELIIIRLSTSFLPATGKVRSRPYRIHLLQRNR